jgi:hypothetical protein
MSEPATQPVPEVLRALPPRAGERPQTGPALPHFQLSDHGDLEQAQHIIDTIAALPGVTLGRSQVSDPRSVAFHLRLELVGASPDQAPLGGEFAHVHPFDGGSQHLVLPQPWGEHLIEKGWAEYHPVAAQLPAPVLFMVYGPRDRAEADHLIAITKTAYTHVRGLEPGSV